MGEKFFKVFSVKIHGKKISPEKLESFALIKLKQFVDVSVDSSKV